MKQSTWLKTGAVVAACAVAGAGAGIAGSAAARSKKNGPRQGTGTTTTPDGDHHGGPGGPGRHFGGAPAHAGAGRLNKAGDGFITVTEDSGTVDSVSGDQLAVKEGIGKVTYKTFTL